MLNDTQRNTNTTNHLLITRSSQHGSLLRNLLPVPLKYIHLRHNAPNSITHCLDPNPQSARVPRRILRTKTRRSPPPSATPQGRADPAPAANGSATANSGRNPLGQRLQALHLQRAEAVVRERDAGGREVGAGPSASSPARRAARGGGYRALESVCRGEDTEAEFAAGLVPHEV